MMDNTTLLELKQALAREHDTLVTELQAFAAKNPAIKGDWNATFPKFEAQESGNHASIEEEADEVEEYEERLAAEHSLESRLLQITAAMERIQKDTYGICAACKKEIPLERLKANPAASACSAHAE